ncbi:MAG: DNA-formamidopyrimidine glycosylase family protein [Pseudomonadota bacterium]
MPEGPTIVILREQAAGFVGKTIVRAHGNSKAVDMDSLAGQQIIALRSWGKHFLVQLPTLALRIHFMLFGSYRINETRPGAAPRLALEFDEGGQLNFYACSIHTLDADLDAQYDWRVDVMSDQWDAKLARTQLRAMPDALVCDALLMQSVFAGVGNIIKNEVLFRIRVHPLSTVGALPAAKLRELVKQARQYSFEFLEWKKAFVLKAHWLAHTKSICPRCNIPFHKGLLGKTRRRSFFCPRCQKLYADAEPSPASKAPGG